MRGPDDLEAPFLELHLDIVPHNRLSLWDHRPEIDSSVNTLGFEAPVVDWGSDASQIPKLRLQYASTTIRRTQIAVADTVNFPATNKRVSN